MGVSEVISAAGTIITQGISITSELITALPFMLISIYFIVGRKFVGLAKNLTMQSRGKRKGG